MVIGLSRTAVETESASRRASRKQAEASQRKRRTRSSGVQTTAISRPVSSITIGMAGRKSVDSRGRPIATTASREISL